MKLLKFTLISILGLSLCTACGGDGDGGETPGPGKPEGPDKSSTTGIDRFDASNIFSRNTYLPDNTAMQGFNLDSDGSVWYTQLSNTNQAQLNWVRAQPNKTPDVQTENKDYMKLTYFGHGTNTALEEDGADRYLWAGAYGVCNAKGQYWNEKLVGRVKYVKGATVKTNECNDYYYIGDYTDLHPSIDAENDLLTINYGDSKNSSYRCFVIYKLSEAKKAPMTNVTITCTDGFQTDRPASTNPVSVVVRCHDLTTLTPVARPRFLKTGYGASGATYYDWQGYDVHKNRLYYTEGQSNYNLFGSFYSGSSFAYVTVFDFEGNIVEERTQVAEGFARGPVTPNDFGCTRSPTRAAPDRSRRPAPPHVALPRLGTCDDRPHRGRRLVRPHLHEDDDTPQSVPHPDEINPENERKKFRSFHARPKPHPAFGEKERVLRTPPDEIRLSFPFQDNITIKQD